MKNKRPMSPLTFVCFAEAIFRERREAIRMLDACDTQSARVHLEYMECILEGALRDFKAERETAKERATEAAKLILANDLPACAVKTLSHPANAEFVEKAAQTIINSFE